MRFFHLSDLHLGKRLGDLSLEEDQRHILSQILALTAQYQPDGILIAGDVYDRSVPSVEAVNLLDDFLTRLAGMKTPVYLISGNHDSPQRLSFGGRLMEGQGIWIEGVLNGQARRIQLKDAFGPLDLWLLPFFRAASVRPFFPDDTLEREQDAMKALLDALPLEPGRRNVLVCHQFITGGGTGPVTADSETIYVGGSDNIDSTLFEPFDYVALGHLHTPQWVGRPQVRYCGSPLKYSFSEAYRQKSVTMVTLEEKGNITIEELPLTPLRDMRIIKGPLHELTSPLVAAQADPNDYLQVILTDEEELLHPMDTLRQTYPNVLSLKFDNSRSRAAGLDPAAPEATQRPLDLLFADFYAQQQGKPLEEEKLHLVRDILNQLEEDA